MGIRNASGKHPALFPDASGRSNKMVKKAVKIVKKAAGQSLKERGGLRVSEIKVQDVDIFLYMDIFLCLAK